MIIRAEVLNVRGRMAQVKFDNGLVGTLPVEESTKPKSIIEVRYRELVKKE